MAMDPDLVRQRRNLLILSLGLIVYDIAGGRVQGGALFGGVVHLHRPFVLVIAAWLAFAYLLWRFWLYGGRSALFIWRNERDTFANSSKKIRALTAKRFEEPCMEIAKRSGRGPGGTPWENPIAFVSLRTIRLVTNGTIYENPPVETHVSWSEALRLHGVLTVRMIISGKAFSDYLLPYIVAGFALLVTIITGA